MLLLRIVAILSAIAIGSGILAFLATRERKYLRFAGQVTKYALIFALVVLSLFFLERVIVF